MRTKKYIVAHMIQEIRKDGTTISTDAKYINPEKIVWMKTRYVGSNSKRPYTIFKLEGDEPFMAEGDIDRFLSAMDVEVIDYICWDWDDEDDEEEEDE